MEVNEMEAKREQTVEEQQAEQKVEDLRKDEFAKIKHRTSQLFELIAFDPTNTPIYRNEIIETNIRLVPHVLKKYRPWNEDQFQLGCLGLIKATHSYDPTRGVPYHSYACFCIERELQVAYKKRMGTFEGILGDSLGSIDETFDINDGDDKSLSVQDIVPDEQAQASFDEMLEEYDLEGIFDKAIFPAIEIIAGKTKGQQTTIDFDKWKELELRYILEMAKEESQKARYTFTEMAKELDMSVQNVRMRHIRVLEAIRNKCIELGYNI